MDVIKADAQKASRIRICTTSDDGADGKDCVTTKPETFPIVNLRNGMMTVTHNGNIPCNRACVRNIWDESSEPRYENLWSTCWSQRDDSAEIIGWACNNGAGIHATVGDSPQCGWTSAGRGAISVYIDSGTSTTVTTSTMSETTTTHTYHEFNNRVEGWIKDLQKTVAANDIRLKNIEDANSQDASEMESLRRDINDNLAASESALELSGGNVYRIEKLEEALANATKEIKQLKETLKMITSAFAGSDNLLKSSQCDSTAECEDGVSASDEGVSIVSSGSVKIETKKCGSVDICSLAERLNKIITSVASDGQ